MNSFRGTKTTHLLGEAEGICEAISVMIKEPILVVGTPQDLSSMFGTESSRRCFQSSSCGLKLNKRNRDSIMFVITMERCCKLSGFYWSVQKMFQSASGENEEDVLHTRNTKIGERGWGSVKIVRQTSARSAVRHTAPSLLSPQSGMAQKNRSLILMVDSSEVADCGGDSFSEEEQTSPKVFDRLSHKSVFRCLSLSPLHVHSGP
jgi:ABC-type multidrug transport system ATPase subunit